MLFQYWPAQGLVQPFLEHQLQGDITDRQFIEDRDKTAVAQGILSAQTCTFLLIRGKSWNHYLGWSVDSVDSNAFPEGQMKP